MKTTVLVFHPSIENSRVNKALAKAAETAEGVEVRYLYDIYPDGNIDVKKEQEILEATDRIVFQFPVYWYSAPAFLRTWQDKVLEYGWAYGSTGTALHGKELLIAASPGASLDMYTKDGVGFSVEEILTPFHATSNFIGTKYLAPFITAGTLNITDEQLQQATQNYIKALTK